MRHHNKNRKFGRKTDVRLGLMRSLAVALILNERITTTEAKAKSLRPYVEQLVTRARKESVSARRLISSRLGQQPEITKKLVDVLAPKYMNRAGGYTRIVKLPQRASDAAPMAIIEFVAE